MLVNSTLRTFVDEWGPATPSSTTFMFFGLAFVTVGLIARFGHRLTPTERLILLVTLASGLLAIRNIIWFALAVGDPRALDGGQGARAAAADVGQASRLPAAAAGARNLGSSRSRRRGRAGVLVRPRVAVRGRRPGREALLRPSSPGPERRAVLGLAALGDPELIGRIAYDVRFELSIARRSTACSGTRIGSGQARVDSRRLRRGGAGPSRPPGPGRSRSRRRANSASSTEIRRITVLERVDAGESAEDVQVHLVTRTTEPQGRHPTRRWAGYVGLAGPPPVESTRLGFQDLACDDLVLLRASPHGPVVPDGRRTRRGCDRRRDGRRA